SASERGGASRAGRRWFSPLVSLVPGRAGARPAGAGAVAGQVVAELEAAERAVGAVAQDAADRQDLAVSRLRVGDAVVVGQIRREGGVEGTQAVARLAGALGAQHHAADLVAVGLRAERELGHPLAVADHP